MLTDLARQLKNRSVEGIRRRRRLIYPPAPGRESEINQLLLHRGLVIIPDYWSREQCDRAREEIDEVCQQQADRVWRDPCDSDNRLYRAESVCPSAARYQEDEFITSIGRSYLGEGCTFWFVLANRVTPKPDNLGSGQGWHRDTAHERQFKSILYLSDVGEDNGPFCIVEGSHRMNFCLRCIAKGLARFGQSRFENDELDAILKAMGTRLTRCTAKAGTLVLADTSTLHGGAPIVEGQRYALTNYVFDEEVVRRHRQNNKFCEYFVVPEDETTSASR